MNLILITIGMILLIGIIIGVCRGAVRLMVSLFTTLLTIVIVVFASPFVAKAIKSYTPMDDMIKDKVNTTMTDAATSYLMGSEEDGQEGASRGLTEEAVKKALKAAGVSEEQLEEYGVSVDEIVNGEITKEELAQFGISSELLSGQGEADAGAAEDVAKDALETMDIPEDIQQKAIEKAEIPDIFKSLLTKNNNEASYEKLGVTTFVGYVGNFLSDLVIHIVSFLATFLIVTIILRAIVFALDFVADLPGVGLVNRLAGGVLGGIGALIIVWVLLVAVTLLYLTPIGRDIYDSIQANDILKMLYDYNPIMKLATKYI